MLVSSSFFIHQGIRASRIHSLESHVAMTRTEGFPDRTQPLRHTSLASRARAARKPHSPCTPGMGGVEEEQR
jgi:hypothetical protein